MTDDAISGSAVCHYCQEDRQTDICEDWQTGEEIPVCEVCQRDFDLNPLEEADT